VSGGVVIVYALYGDRASAEAAARDAVDNNLAACANILSPCRSVYVWQGERQEADEVPVLFKTHADKADALRTHLTQNHGYDVPAVLSWPADAAPDYARWVADMVLR
jgi:periplasmic divalent cation tolerance protein